MTLGFRSVTTCSVFACGSRPPVWCWKFLVSGLLLLPARLLAGDVVIQVKTNYYPVSGSSTVELCQSLFRSRPWAVPVDAMTGWKLQCDFTPQAVSGRFVVDRFQIRTRVTVTLPKWTPRQPIEPGLQEQWWTYLKALAAHEQGHVQVARDATAALLKRFQELPAYPSRWELEHEGHRAVKDTIEKHRERDRQYDRETRHGVLQGAAFPPSPDPALGGRLYLPLLPAQPGPHLQPLGFPPATDLTNPSFERIK